MKENPYIVPAAERVNSPRKYSLGCLFAAAATASLATALATLIFAAVYWAAFLSPTALDGTFTVDRYSEGR
ncbi:hypothetical protein EC9_03230 [Rosistilla ulvae]|uniref:Uncharacterized protein n=1 Tax=Rosistilla ulvae TaxID=1930277 RepID=A0A517LU64_9BACT|nr:hypothetical protein [Rosistilla ulvae]QDS86164.1 hypothetical protein EC9_03230 [Rosistilla ulvae]